MPEGMKIKKAKLRGIKSFGMICSERELGFSDDHDGIWVLDDSYGRCETCGRNESGTCGF